MTATILNGEQKPVPPCARCQRAEVTFVIRTEKICKDCLFKYIRTKVFKRIETNKLRSGYGEPPKKLLVCVSLGISSLSLLQILDAQIRARLEQGRSAGYAIHLLHIDHSSPSNSPSHETEMVNLRKSFPHHPVSIVPIEDYSDFDINLDIITHPQEDPPSTETPIPVDTKQNFQRILSAANSPTSRADLIATIRRRLTAAFARQHGCDGILYGDTTTRLAEKTLSETAKGRGGLLPHLVGDGLTPDNKDGGIHSCYPMRDLLKKELRIYADITDPPLTPLIAKDEENKVVASSKGNTIDALMRQYFESVEEGYPSIVANVVRITGKLRRLSASKGAGNCSLCQHAVGAELWGGDQGVDMDTRLESYGTIATDQTATLCYGCTRTLQLA